MLSIVRPRRIHRFRVCRVVLLIADFEPADCLPLPNNTSHTHTPVHTYTRRPNQLINFRSHISSRELSDLNVSAHFTSAALPVDPIASFRTENHRKHVCHGPRIVSRSWRTEDAVRKSIYRSFFFSSYILVSYVFRKINHHITNAFRIRMFFVDNFNSQNKHTHTSLYACVRMGVCVSKYLHARVVCVCVCIYGRNDDVCV